MSVCLINKNLKVLAYIHITLPPHSLLLPVQFQSKEQSHLLHLPQQWLLAFHIPHSFWHPSAIVCTFYASVIL